MAEGDPTQPPRQSAATALAQWTKLDIDRFGDCYSVVCPVDQGEEWNVLVVLRPTDTILAACEQGEANDFLDALANAVAKIERRAGRSANEVAEMLDTVCRHGVMEGMTDQQKGFMDAEILLPLLQARDACTIVKQKTPAGLKQLGTAFLVRPDLVLTAAHVAREFDATQADPWLPGLRDGLEFHFRPRPGQSSTDSVVILPAKEKALVATANPHGTPTSLERSLASPADRHLDFALIRLAQRVEYLSPVEIVDTAAVKPGKCCWAFGYPATDRVLMDVDLVTDVNNEAGRWLHKANTGEGMSGGCCVSHEGLVVGLHEGKLDITLNGVAAKRNRGVSIGNIRRELCTGRKDPFKTATNTPGLEIQDPTLVEELYLAGLRLSGDGRETLWRDKFSAAIGGQDPDTFRPLPPFHPWFERDKVERWIESSDRTERLCYVFGETGVGKTFCGRILREKIDPAREDLLAFSPTQINAMSWADAISQMLSPEDPQYRTASATVRYTDFDAVTEELKRRSCDGARRLNILIDFGPAGTGDRFIGTQWIGLIASFLAFDWIRVMAIGLEQIERDALEDTLVRRPELANVRSRPFKLAPIDRATFDQYADNLARARDKVLSAADVRQRIRATQLPDPDAVTQDRSLLMAATALAAILFEAGLDA